MGKIFRDATPEQEQEFIEERRKSAFLAESKSPSRWLSTAGRHKRAAGRVEVRVEVRYFELMSGTYLPSSRNGLQHLIFYYMDVDIPVEKPKEHSHSEDHESEYYQLVSRIGIKVSPGIIMVWPDVESGTHTVAVQLMDIEDRSPLDPPVADEVTFTVANP